jgi:hypothetical protein
MGLEDQLYGSKIIRNYLKLFSENQQARVAKASIMLGIQYLSKVSPNNDLRLLSIRDLEDLVVKQQVDGSLVLNKKAKKKRSKV